MLNYNFSNSKDLGAFFKKHRKSKNFNIVYISEITNLGNRFISEMENGKESCFLNKILFYAKNLSLNFYIIPNRANKFYESYGLSNDIFKIGDIIKYHRENQKMTIKNVVDISALNPRIISNIENGKNINIKNLFLILKSYGLKLIVLPRNIYIGDYLNER